jgi:hypothetical protein
MTGMLPPKLCVCFNIGGIINSIVFAHFFAKLRQSKRLSGRLKSRLMWPRKLLPKERARIHGRKRLLHHRKVEVIHEDRSAALQHPATGNNPSIKCAIARLRLFERRDPETIKYSVDEFIVGRLNRRTLELPTGFWRTDVRFFQRAFAPWRFD